MAKDNTLLLIGGAAALGFAWYKGMLAQFGIPGPSSAPAAPAVDPVAAAKAAADAAAKAALATAAATPALGTKVTKVSDLLLQVAAKDPYIIPDDATFAPYAVNPLPGYQAFYLDGTGNVLLRQDVYDAANAQVGATGTSLKVADLQSLMKTKGLTGFGDYQRHIASRTGAYRPVRFVA